MVSVGRENYIDLFTNHLRAQSRSNSEYLSRIIDLYEVIIQTTSGRVVFIDSGVLGLVIDMSIKIASQPAAGGSYSTMSLNSNLADNATFNVTDKMLALATLVSLWNA